MEKSLKKVLANSFMFYIKSHNFHINVTGVYFKQFHDLFGEIYEEAFAEVDLIAEHIRSIGKYAPISISRIATTTDIKDDGSIPDALSMAKRLIEDNKIVIASLYEAYKEADAAKELGLANFLQDRIDAHNKTEWMLKATTE